MGKKAAMVEDGAGNMVPKGSKTDPEMVAQRAAAAERRAAKAAAKETKPAAAPSAGGDYSGMGRIKLLKLAKERGLDFKPVQKDPDALRQLLKAADGDDAPPDVEESAQATAADTGLKLLTRPITIGGGDGSSAAATDADGGGDDEGAAIITVRVSSTFNIRITFIYLHAKYTEYLFPHLVIKTQHIT